MTTQNSFGLLSATDGNDHNGRSRSSSKKRKSSDGSPIDVEPAKNPKKKPNRPPPKCGTGGAREGGPVGKVADFQMYVGRTHPDTTEHHIKELVKEYTKGHSNTNTEENEGVEVKAVEILKEMKNDNGDVASKCWKVTFAHTDKETMMNDSSWPAGWTYRLFFPSRQPKQNKVPLYRPGVHNP